MVVGDKEIDDKEKMHANHWWFWLPCGCSDTVQWASPNGAHPRLHWKPLDAAIGQVPAPYCPGSCHGNGCSNDKEGDMVWDYDTRWWRRHPISTLYRRNYYGIHNRHINIKMHHMPHLSMFMLHLEATQRHVNLWNIVITFTDMVYDVVGEHALTLVRAWTIMQPREETISTQNMDETVLLLPWAV